MSKANSNVAQRKSKYLKKQKESELINMQLDIVTLDLFCRYVISNNSEIRRAQLINLDRLLKGLNWVNFDMTPDKQIRVDFILKALEAKLMYNITDPAMIRKHVSGNLLEADNTPIDLREISINEVNWLNHMISETLDYNSIYNKADGLIDACIKLKANDFGSKGELVRDFESRIGDLQNEFRRNKTRTANEEIFSLHKDVFDHTMRDYHKTLLSPSRRIICGMRGLNEMLGGGFENGRQYLFFGLPGEGKSLTLLDLAIQIRKNNKFIQTKDPTKRPCVVLLTMENGCIETVERMYEMCTGGDIKTVSADAAINKFLIDGEMALSDDSPVDIVIKFVPSMSKDTSYLYTLTEDLADQGMEVICMIQDYIGRIHSVNRNSEIRIELGEITDEFKTFATVMDIPIISAHQLNRDASKHVDEGRKSNKADLVKMIGRSNISESMLILNNVDGAFIITPEYAQDGNKYLGMQKIKSRAKSCNLQYIYQPYSDISPIKLLEDRDQAVSVYRTTMKNEDQMAGAGTYRVSQYQTVNITDLDETPEWSDFKSSVGGRLISDNAGISAAYTYYPMPMMVFDNDINTSYGYGNNVMMVFDEPELVSVGNNELMIFDQ